MNAQLKFSDSDMNELSCLRSNRKTPPKVRASRGEARTKPAKKGPGLQPREMHRLMITIDHSEATDPVPNMLGRWQCQMVGRSRNLRNLFSDRRP